MIQGLPPSQTNTGTVKGPPVSSRGAQTRKPPDITDTAKKFQLFCDHGYLFVKLDESRLSFTDWHPYIFQSDNYYYYYSMLSRFVMLDFGHCESCLHLHPKQYFDTD